MTYVMYSPIVFSFDRAELPLNLHNGKLCTVSTIARLAHWPVNEEHRTVA